ncbi:4Fe-4S double cluster binding domain-containing protein [Alkaliphilus peptidifermentans]|uniref:4Fe-4S dicluster domain-containing protein n=1 Tax=Alkaliphilus peptidifermentans DSM 18978 TaxID=1120976 RepID=A0A1G5I182_9FIRM|nr:4Fe-4S double cluster binding domain-containing protein [Alkaliphilus peptidifermentans]SCY69783.1 4Fe-4S dicluster domain-containing protein [Alkaliphilus peptidifermentans DSM 18978]
MDKQEKLTKFLFDQGIVKIGYSFLEDQLPDEFKHLKSGITIVVRLSDQIVSDINIKDGPTHTYFHHYRTVNAFIDQVTFKTTNLLQQWGYLAMAVPASQSINKDGWKFKSLFPHRTAATRSGIGWIGKNCCLITEEFGPRVRLGTVLTDMELEYDQPIEESKCQNCNICVKSCPAMALKGGTWKAGMPREDILDPSLCSTHMHKQYQSIGRGAVCGICVKACPKGTENLRR